MISKEENSNSQKRADVIISQLTLNNDVAYCNIVFLENEPSICSLLNKSMRNKIIKYLLVNHDHSNFFVCRFISKS